MPPTPAPYLAAPVLTGPGDQVSYRGDKEQIYLIWDAVPGMTADDRYQVVIRWIEQGALQEKSDLFTPATSIQMPPWLWGRADQPERRYQWFVRPVRLSTDGQGGELVSPLGPTSPIRTSTGTDTRMPSKLTSCLALLADENRPVRTIDLADISDLSRSQVAEFHAAWHDLSPSRRLELITVMVEQAETNIHLIFHAALRACLTDGDAQVRRLAIEGLWEDERVSLVPTLSGLLAHDPSADVRSAAATALGRFVLLGVLGDIAEEPARQAEDALHLAWERSGEPVSVRRRVLESLSSTDTADLHVLIGDAYYSDNELMRQSAIFAMGRSANPRWNKIVLAELNSRERCHAIRGGGSRG